MEAGPWGGRCEESLCAQPQAWVLAERRGAGARAGRQSVRTGVGLQVRPVCAVPAPSPRVWRRPRSLQMGSCPREGGSPAPAGPGRPGWASQRSRSLGQTDREQRAYLGVSGSGVLHEGCGPTPLRPWAARSCAVTLARGPPGWASESSAGAGQASGFVQTSALGPQTSALGPPMSALGPPSSRKAGPRALRPRAGAGAATPRSAVRSPFPRTPRRPRAHGGAASVVSRPVGVSAVAGAICHSG